jgi:branched-chain amino acid transport system permease protein
VLLGYPVTPTNASSCWIRETLLGTEIAKAIVGGILTGGVYALMAAGLTLIFGVMEIINIAQGALVIVGAYLSFVLQVHLHIDPFIGLIFTMPIMFVLGVIIEWGFIRRLKTLSLKEF